MMRLSAGPNHTMSLIVWKLAYLESSKTTLTWTRCLHEAIFQDNTAQLNMRLPPAMKAVLSKLARERTTDATTLARIWLAERLEQELKAG